jgi:hypothetical protein
MGFRPLQRHYRGSPLHAEDANLCYVPPSEFLTLLTVYSSPRLRSLISCRLRSWDSPFRVFPVCEIPVPLGTGCPPAVTNGPGRSQGLGPATSLRSRSYPLPPHKESAPGVSPPGDPHQRPRPRGSRRSPARQLQGFAPSQRATVFNAGEDVDRCRSPRGLPPLQGSPPCRGRNGFPLRTLSFLGSPDPKAKLAVNLRASFPTGLVQLTRGRKSNRPSWGSVPFRYLRLSALRRGLSCLSPLWISPPDWLALPLPGLRT